MKSTSTLKISLWIAIFSMSFLNAQGFIDGFFSEVGALSVTTSYSNSSFSDFYLGETLTEGVPDHNEIQQDIFDVYAKYEIAPDLVTYINIPYIMAKGNGVPDAVNGQTEVAGIQDVALGIKYRFHRFKYETSDFSIIGGLTFEVPGNYEQNGILSIGSGAFSTDFTAGGHFQSEKGYFLTSFFTYSYRDDVQFNGHFIVPNAMMGLVKLGYANKYFYADGWLDHTQSLSGVDIDGDDFVQNGIAQFPATKVVFTRVGGTLSKKIGRSGFAASLAGITVLDGRNTGKATTFSVGLTYEVELL